MSNAVSNIYDKNRIEEWKQRVREAKAARVLLKDFLKAYNLSSNQWVVLKQLINDAELTSFPKNFMGKKRGAHKRKQPTYTKMDLTPPEPIAQPETAKPMFCLLLAFESKEQALSVMGRYL